MNILNINDKQEFIVRINDDCQLIFNRFSKLTEGCIFLCKQGEACIEIDSEEYHIVPNTHMVLIPGIIIGDTQISNDFLGSYILFPSSLFYDVTTRIDPSFYRFLKDTPLVIMPEDRISSINRTLLLVEELYLDKDNCFRQQILHNHIQSFLLNIYDKTRRLFLDRQPEGLSRQENLFKQFIQLIHEHCIQQREVSFYANQLCISSRYLSSVVQHVANATAKSIIDKHVILEIKTMLKSTNLSIQEISNRLHFPDQSFFGRYFKKHTGISPLRYRNEL